METLIIINILVLSAVCILAVIYLIKLNKKVTHLQEMIDEAMD